MSAKHKRRRTRRRKNNHLNFAFFISNSFPVHLYIIYHISFAYIHLFHRRMSAILPSPSNTRLVTIAAHVDHGKTTLADSLCEHNGIISERLAGTVRYLDSMEEEQRRGITIRSSAIGLKHNYKPIKSKKNPNNNTATLGQSQGQTQTPGQQMVIHLIDSPGHVDFSMEVSSALQICDGAILLVDVVEGMCARTQSILREAYSQRLVPVLVLNKIDRLCTDLGLTLNESYVRIRNVIENVNAAASNMIRSARAQALDREYDNSQNNPLDHKHEHDDPVDDDDDEGVQDDELEIIWNFDPVKGNVVFTSALFGWGFTIPSLARTLFKSNTILLKPPLMRQYLFGDFKYRTDNGKVIKWKQNDDSPTMFAEYGLKPMWDIMMGISAAQTSLGLESVLFGGGGGLGGGGRSHGSKGVKKDLKIKATTVGMADDVMGALHIGCTTSPTAAQSLQVPNTIEELQQVLNNSNASCEETILRALLRRHRPLSDAVLDAVCDVCPSPAEASTKFRTGPLSLVPRVESLLDEKINVEFQKVQNAVKYCVHSSDPSAITVAHCCKFISTDRAHINDPELFSHLDNLMGADDGDGVGIGGGIILGVARVMCGTLCSKDLEYYCFGPKHKDSMDENVPKRRVRLYLLMGSAYIRVNKVPAGHICAVHGLEELQLKTMTLSSSPCGMHLNAFNQGLQPLVKVNVEAVSNSGKTWPCFSILV